MIFLGISGGFEDRPDGPENVHHSMEGRIFVYLCKKLVVGENT